jgi:protoheme IX farnesyltransferase
VFAYGVSLCALSLILSLFTLNLVTTGMIGLGIFFYVIVYTSWLKRNNVSNIVIGGFAGSAASMAGWSVATGSVDTLGFLVGWLVFMWTPPHFWCLAMKTRRVSKCECSMLPVLVGNKTSQYLLAAFDSIAILLPIFLAGLVYLTVAIIAGLDYAVLPL